jgi:hypothetical protein
MKWTPQVLRTLAVLVGLVMAVGPGASRAGTQPASSPSLASVSSGHCPTNSLLLPGNGVARAAEQALDEAAFDYQGLDTSRARVQAADRSAFAGPRGAQVRQQCGAKVARHTVVVQLLFPRMLPSASLSQGVVFVARFPRGYRIWEIAH